MSDLLIGYAVVAILVAVWVARDAILDRRERGAPEDPVHAGLIGMLSGLLWPVVVIVAMLGWLGTALAGERKQS